MRHSIATPAQGEVSIAKMGDVPVTVWNLIVFRLYHNDGKYYEMHYRWFDYLQQTTDGILGLLKRHFAPMRLVSASKWTILKVNI